ncbi:AOX, alternative oxidase mitochondrial precursor [Irpex rosettiformis]|uniref:AOX, alternative oxidase mitochondrial n=1 Tax=Irpex rosettiformis TaxID=378272 RepID=A0ACB8TWS4_9APHY|nr:AOX, alternative oxidase mitochondrial precursor [Irpex rosettiformis]
MLRAIASPALRAPAFRVCLATRLPTVVIARSFSSASPRYKPIVSTPADQPSSKGSEGAHPKDSVPQRTDALTSDPIDTAPTHIVKGDWVLFHPVYSTSELHAVKVMHRAADKLSDKAAYFLVRTARKCFDLISGYKDKKIPEGTNMSVEELQKQGYILTELDWLNRILFLESIAGVPGMVGATLRHLRSLRLMKRDSGWIHTLLEEAENERMHLMTFMTVRKPSIWLRGLILGAQGVFYNLFFMTYLFSPRACHRFVAYLEEEAVRTYTHCIEEVEAGHVPAWENKPAPAIAKEYWRMKDDATLLDVIYAVRSDETTHRFVNHSLANLNSKTDVNPFAIREPDMHVKGAKLGFERDEAEKYVEQSREIMEKAAARN